MNSTTKIIIEGKNLNLKAYHDAVLDLIKDGRIDRIEIIVDKPYKDIYDSIRDRICSLPGVKLEPSSNIQFLRSHLFTTVYLLVPFPSNTRGSSNLRP